MWLKLKNKLKSQEFKNEVIFVVFFLFIFLLMDLAGFGGCIPGLADLDITPTL